MGTVFLDQGYWQRAIASRPTTTVKAYILGGFAWFAIPFGFATTLGLSAVALTGNPAFPTYPEPMTASQVSSGLSAPFAAQALLGQGGAVAALITLFMAVTSSSSSQLIAVSSVLTFDVYKTYIRPDATSKQLIFVSHAMICLFACVMATFACIWNAAGIDLGWLYYVMGLIIGGAVMPAAFSVTWKGQTKAGAILGALSGLAVGIISWLSVAKTYYGEITIASTGSPFPTMAGNMSSFLVGLIVSVAVSYIKPDDFDWAITRAINTEMPLEGLPVVATTEQDAVDVKTEKDHGSPEDSELKSDQDAPPTPPSPADVVEGQDKDMIEDARFLESPEALRRSYKLALILSVVLTLAMDFLIPIPMFLSHYVYSIGFFTAWIVISFIWVFAALAICGFLPIWETRHFWKPLLRKIFTSR